MQKLTYIQSSSSLWSSTILQNQIIWCEQTAKTWLSHPIEVAIDNVFADRKRHKIGKKTILFFVFGQNTKRKDYGRLWFVILFSCLRLYAVYGLYVVGYERQRANAAPFFFLLGLIQFVRWHTKNIVSTELVTPHISRTLFGLVCICNLSAYYGKV